MSDYTANCPARSAEVIEAVRRQPGENGQAVLVGGLLTEIRLCAARYARGLRAAGYERVDLEQELALSCLQRFRRYDPRRSSPKTFANVLARSRVASIAEKACAQKRDHRACESLNKVIPTGLGEVERIERISNDIYEVRLGRRSRSAEELLDLEIDVRRAVGRLAPALRALAKALMEEERAGAAAHKLGLSRATAYRRIAELRDKLRAAGLDRYQHSNRYRTEAAA